MKDRNIYLAERSREVFLHGRWIANTNWKEQIENLPFEIATYKIENINSIAQLTFHVSYYLKGLNQVFEGGPLEIRDAFSFDMEQMNSAQDWQHLVYEFLHHAELFSNHLEKIEDKMLDHAFVNEKYGSYLRNIEGVIEHGYYHLGQLSLLKKLATLKTLKPGSLKTE